MTQMPNYNEKGGIDFILSKFELLSNGVDTPFDENEFLELINFYITDNELKKAITVFSFANELFPESFDIKLSEAQLLIESGLYTAATKKLKNLYKKEPNDLSLLMLIGLNYSQAGIINRALSFFDKAINLVPKKEQGFFMFNIAQTFINLGRFDIAIFYLTNARRLSPDDDQIILDLAYCMERSEKYKNSEKLFNIYLKKNPFSKIAWYNLAVVLSHLGNTSKSIKAYNFAIAIDPTFSSAFFNKANLYFDQKEYFEAITNFSVVIKHEPENSESLLLRGISYFYTNQIKLAEKDIKLSLKINEKNAEAWYYLSQIYFSISLKRSKKALFNALKLNNIKSEYWNFAAKIFFKEKKYRLADISFMHSISFDPFIDEYWFEYSDYKKRTKKLSDAISILKMGKDFITDTYNYYLRISSLYLSIGETTNAINSFNKAFNIDKNAITKIVDFHSNKAQIEFLINSHD